MEFGQAIDSSGSSLLVFTAGTVIRLCPEDVVGRNVYQQSARLCHDAGQDFGSLRIELLSKCLVCLCGINIGECCTIHDGINAATADDVAHGLGFLAGVIERAAVIVAVARADIRKEIGVGSSTAGHAQFVAQLSVGTSDKYVHKGCL